MLVRDLLEIIESHYLGIQSLLFPFLFPFLPHPYPPCLERKEKAININQLIMFD